jgi:ferrous iron transport protein A
MNAQRSSVSPIPLTQLPIGGLARIVEVRANPQTIRRLLGLGLRVGSEVNVLHHRGRGVVVASSGNRIALGAGVADILMAEPVEPIPA